MNMFDLKSYDNFFLSTPMTPTPLARPLGVISKIRKYCALLHTYIYYVPKFQVPISNGVGGVTG